MATPEPIQLAKGYNRIEVDFVSNGRVSSLRVYWSGDGFTTEPLSPDLLFSRGDDPELVRGEERRAGRFLYATFGCARCHELPGNVKDGEIAMPELRFQRAPSLEGIGRRLGTPWMARWILDARAMRPEARMPQVLHGEAREQQAADLAAYLASLQDGPALRWPEPTDDLVAAGEKHFEALGCIGCHHLEDPKKDDALGRLSLFFANAKFQPGALEAFLKSPHLHYPWIRMPDFHLDAKEVPALAAFLRERSKGKVKPAAAKCTA